jgi:hypothetical protein
LRTAFRTAVEAAAAFEDVVDDEPRHRSLAKAVVAYLEAVEPGSTRPAGNSAGGAGSSGAPSGSGGGRVSPVQPSGHSSGPLMSAPAATEGRPAAGLPTQAASRSAWSEIRRRVGIAAGALGLLVVLGVIYLGLHSYANRSIDHVGHHALTTESHPAAPGGRTGHAWPPKPPASSPPTVLPAARHPL